MSALKPRVMGKVTRDDMTKYAIDHGTSLHPIFQELFEMTSKHAYGRMISDHVCFQLMTVLLKTIQAKNVLDIGVFTGASSLTAALCIPEDGKVVALDVSEEFTNLAKPFWKKAGVDKKIDLRIAPALESLDAMIKNGESGNFDFAYIDADKKNYTNYFDRCLELIRSGGIIMIDNVLWDNKVGDDDFQDEDTNGIRECNERVKKCDKVVVSMLNMADGITVAYVK